MSDSSFPRTRKGGAAGASPRLAAADAILQRLRGKKKNLPQFPLAAKGACCHRQVCLRCGWLSWEKTSWLELVQEALLSSSYS